MRSPPSAQPVPGSSDAMQRTDDDRVKSFVLSVLENASYVNRSCGF